MTLPTKKELKDAFQKLISIHEEYLARHDVKLPKLGSCKEIWLSMLMHYEGEEVHKDQISAAVYREHPEAGYDQQVRHLKREGWHIEGSGGSRKLNPYVPSPDYANEQARRRGRLAAGDFSQIKVAFGNRCATCGATEGRPDSRYGSDLVVLQEGHQDPREPSDEPDNIIPQCQFCNRSYKGDFVFDNKGRVRAVADVGPVQRAREPVQQAVLE